MNLRDIEAQAKAIAPILRDFVAKTFQTLEVKLRKEIEQSIDAARTEIGSNLPVLPGIDLADIAQQAAALIPPPEKGEDGKSITLEDVEPLIYEAAVKAISALPVPKDGEPGSEGQPGKDADPIPMEVVERMIAEAVAKAISAIPLPKDGEPGRDALELDIQPRIDESKSYTRGALATHNGGLWRAHANTDGMRGWECIVDGVCGVGHEQVNERNIVNVVTMASGKRSEAAFSLPTMIYRHVWKEGHYQKGDVVTFGGCIWHCDQDTDTKPGEGAKHWTLAVKKGRDGKSA